MGWGIALVTLCAVARADTVAIRADTILTVSGAPIRNGVILVKDGKILEVGSKVLIPGFARVIHAAVAMPGLVDPHTYLGCQNETDEPVDAITPDLRACDAFDPEAPMLRRAVAAGITSVGLAPGNGNVFAGQVSAVRLGGKPAVLKAYAAQKLSISMDAANAQRNPTSFAGVMTIAQTTLSSARRGAATSSTRQTAILVGEFPTRLSERTAALQPVLTGKVGLFVHAPRAVDVEAALRLADDFHVHPVMLHAAEGANVAGSLRSHAATVVLGPLKFADADRTLANPGKLAKAGVKVAFCTDSPLSDPGSLRLSAHLAVKYGMGRDAAIRAITLTSAEALGLAGRTGSIEAGKDADLLLLSGDPLDLTSRVVALISGGHVVYEGGSR